MTRGDVVRMVIGGRGAEREPAPGSTREGDPGAYGRGAGRFAPDRHPITEPEREETMTATAHRTPPVQPDEVLMALCRLVDAIAETGFTTPLPVRRAYDEAVALCWRIDAERGAQ